MYENEPDAMWEAIINGRRPVTKVKRYHKNWVFGPDGKILPLEKLLKSFWHREISAAKLILEKGK